ncbi:dTDP-glucose 4,6-dehydratase [Metabacillus fastidiosus]|uniref:dTDP-glucose 4,6-dehydratase n=1 Tax=Metabacillus fastidiosus TaxID=1458 RepID=UPI002E20C82E|nr:dTDP-glucose 4,6-dehydratase [Metabacillus fastidiosus]MED4533618.1 dTDP-glucose 4,6-dehydratase [Metabacillus fastidiosus]
MGNLLVTGGAGFIGFNFIKYILENTEHSLTIIDSLTYASNEKELMDLIKHPRVRFFKADIVNVSSINQVMNRSYEAVVHFAAESHVDRSIECAEQFVKTNVIGTYNILQYVLNGSVSKMIHISTDEVYGSLLLNDTAFTEMTPISPNNPYSATKASSDLLALAFQRTYQLPVIITRCSNNFGPYQHIEKFIPKTIINALNNKEIPVYGDGLQIRDWLFVEDHCRAIHLVLEKGKSGEIYNIGGENEKTNLEVAQKILTELGANSELIHFVEDRRGHDRRYAINANKIKKEIGWEQKYEFDEALEKTIHWYKQRYS